MSLKKGVLQLKICWHALCTIKCCTRAVSSFEPGAGCKPFYLQAAPERSRLMPLSLFSNELGRAKEPEEQPQKCTKPAEPPSPPAPAGAHSQEATAEADHDALPGSGRQQRAAPRRQPSATMLALQSMLPPQLSPAATAAAASLEQFAAVAAACLGLDGPEEGNTYAASGGMASWHEPPMPLSAP